MEYEKIETLDHYALKTLEELPKWNYPNLKIEKSDRNIFMGSGDAANVGIIFSQVLGGRALDVSDYKLFFENYQGRDLNIYIVCASGGKDGLKMAQWLSERGWNFKLITSNNEPPMAKYMKAEDIFVFPSIKEPPTYNVSTYAAMIYWLLREDLAEIGAVIKNLKVPDLRKYKYVFFLAQDKYEVIAKMATRKVSETLAGVGANGGGFSNAVHGMLLQPNKERLVFCLNTQYNQGGDVFGADIDSYLGLLLVIHYAIGKNQTNQDSENILRNYEENAKKQGWEFNKVW